MGESMQGLHRTHRCSEVSNKNIEQTVTVMGWVQKRRNLGSLIFIDLRDRSGLLQIVFDQNSVGDAGFEKAGTLRSEYVVAVVGKVQKRSAAVNENLKTGDIEVIAESLRILSEAETPPREQPDKRRTTFEIPLFGFAQAGFAAKYHNEKQSYGTCPRLYGKRRVFGD